MVIESVHRRLTRLRTALRPRKLVKLLAGVALVEAMLLPLYACDPFNTGFDDVEPAVLYEARVKSPAPEPGDRIVVMNWNAKFGGGRIDFWFDCHGDRVLMSKSEVIENLEGLVRKIRQVNPDILVIQEVDIDSKRAAYVDQMQFLLDHTELNYGAYASQWKADFVPTDGLGRINSGNGTLSRWPIRNAHRIALELSSEQDPITRYFYLKRNILEVVTDIPGFGPLHVLNVHADAFGKDGTKKKHIDRFKAELDRIAATGQLVVGAGDLNTLPPGSQVQHGFDDSVCRDEDFLADDFRDEADWLDALYADYASAIPLDDYQADNARYFTHTTAADGFWNRTLDYIFTNGAFVPGSGLVHQDRRRGGMETMPLSDHAPLTVTLMLEAP